VLVTGAEKLSAIVDWSDRSTAVLFGDGAGAVVLTASDGRRGILSSHIEADGTLADLLCRPGGGTVHPPDEAMLRDRSYYMQMAGREVFKAAVRCMADAADRALQSAGLSGKDVDLLIPHQANIRIIESTASHAGIPMERVYVNVDRYGNTSSASIPIALDEARQCGRLAPGMVVLLVAFGAGFAWGSVVMRW
jgi:3-oxoacyl-[acyl-carrier-protein] synthase-3